MRDLLPTMPSADGKHVCPLYDTAREQLTVALSYLKDGFAHRDQCILLMPELKLPEARAALEAAGLDVTQALESGALQFWIPQYMLSSDASFDPNHAVTKLSSTHASAVSAGYSSLRFVADMDWALEAKVPVGKLVAYEALLDEYVSTHDLVVLCQFNRARWEPAHLHDILRTHSVVVIGDLVCPNPYYEPPLLQDDKASLDVVKRGRADWWIRNLQRGRRAEIAKESIAAELKREKERIQLVLDSTTEGIYGIDRDSRCTFANRACERMFGVDAAGGMLGKNMHELTHHSRPDGQPYPLSECAIHRRGRFEGAHYLDEVFWRADGTRLDAEYFAAPMRRDGEDIGAVVTFFDTSERKLLEAQLRQSQKLEGIGRLAGGVAHDFNNLLTIIIAYAEHLLSASVSVEAARSMVGEILKAGTRGAALTQQLLVFSRKHKSCLKIVDLNYVVKNVETMLQRVLGEDVRLELKLDPTPPTVKVDPTQLEQVLLNLAINARDAMTGGGRLTIETAGVVGSMKAGSDVQTWARVSVRDTGEGMSDEIKQKIFEPFFTTKEVGRGTGLGLAMVHGVVQQCGGTIDVQSRLGVGTCFEIYLPTSTGAVAVDTRDDVATMPIVGGGETLLVVEDDEGVRTMLVSALSKLGYSVLTADSGSKALQTYGRDEAPAVDLLITDVIMPGINGAELAEKMQESHRQLRVLYISGYTYDASLRRGPKQERMHFLPKPFSYSSLAAGVREALGDSSFLHHAE